MRLVCISDTHSLHRQLAPLPAGDILIHAGDITMHGDLKDVVDFNSWLQTLPYRHKLVIAGNHDYCAQESPEQMRRVLTSAQYLHHEALEICGVKFFGSPWQPRFMNMAFNLDRGKELERKWAEIPEDTHVLITHAPAFGILDRVHRGPAVGCEDLSKRLRQLQSLRLHVFGHIHEAYGETPANGIEDRRHWAINASTCTLAYRPTNAPLVHVLNID